MRALLSFTHHHGIILRLRSLNPHRPHLQPSSSVISRCFCALQHLFYSFFLSFRASMSASALFRATRPWSLPVTVSPVLLGSAVAWHTSPSGTVSLFSLLLALLGGLSVHCFGNLVNTAEDFVCGVDRKENDAHDRALVDGSVTLQQVRMLSKVCLAVAAASTGIIAYGFLGRSPPPDGSNSPLLNFSLLLLAGLFLAWSYTGPPLRLKYHRLGDVCILLSFGPLLSVGAAFVQTGFISSEAAWLSFPLALLTENILHANNARDIEIDLAAGANTLANSVGFDASRVIFKVFYAAAFLSLPLYALRWQAPTLLLPLIMLAKLPGLLKAFDRHDPSLRRRSKKEPAAAATTEVDICDLCGQFSFGFGVLLTLGVLLS